MECVAVIGLGNISIRHRRNLKILFPAVKLFAMSATGRIPTSKVSDCDQLVSNMDELITEGVELVIIASPAPFHVQHSIPLIKAGIPVLIEKPVTTTSDDASIIQQAIDQYGTPVAIGYCLRYLPSAVKLRSLLKANKLGVLYNAHIEVGQYLPDWRASKDYQLSVSANKDLGGGVLLELSHELDYAHWLVGDLFLENAILRTSQQLGLDVEDIADVIAVNEKGTVVTIHLDFLQRPAYRQCRFVGSEGRIDWDLIENKLVLSTPTEKTILYHQADWDKNQMYLAMIEDFVQMIQGNEHTCVSLREAKATVLFIEEINKYKLYIEN